MKILALLLLTIFGLVAAETPRSANDLVIQMPTGARNSLSSFRGKTVVLVFIQTTDPHSQNSVQILSRIQQDYEARNVQVLAAAIDQEGSVRDFIATFRAAFPIGSVYRESAQTFLQLSPMERFQVPAITIITPRGVIQKQFISDSGRDVDTSVRAALDEIIPPVHAAPK